MKPLADRFLELPEPHSLRKEIAELIRAVRQEFPCDEHDMEPNTTMDFFRCDKCGVRPSIAGALTKLDERLKEKTGD